MQFSDLQATVSYWLDDLAFGYFTQTQVKIWLNNAQKRLQKRLVKTGNQQYQKVVQTTLVVNQPDYVLPLDFKALDRLEVVTGGAPPNEARYPVSPITLNQQDLVLTGTGSPRWYSFKRNRLVLYPAPDTAYTLRLYYTYEVSDMVNDNDVPDAPESYHEYMALLAAEDGFLKDQRGSEILAKKMAEYEHELDADANSRNRDTPRTIRETGNSDSGSYF